jgi:pyruvate,orthophosphate dikinase
MARAAGLLTSKGGFVSHAAVVARGWGIPAVVGASAVEVGDGTIVISGRRFSAGETITIDGSTGEVFAGEVCGNVEIVPEAAKLLSWAGDLGIGIGDGSGPVADRVATDGVADGSALADVEPSGAEKSQDDVVRSLLVRGPSTLESLALSLLADPASLRPLLDGAVAGGMVEISGGCNFRLTADGKLQAGELMVADRERWGVDNAGAALDGFVPLDHRMKDTVTAWQMKEVDSQSVLNDHGDPDYDAGVLARLGSLHDDMVIWLTGLSAGLGRLDAYRVRLERALALARGGDQRYVASPRVESYHSVWFELHEDLIRLSGRKRAEEMAAGRA